MAEVSDHDLAAARRLERLGRDGITQTHHRTFVEFPTRRFLIPARNVMGRGEVRGDDRAMILVWTSEMRAAADQVAPVPPSSLNAMRIRIPAWGAGTVARMDEAPGIEPSNSLFQAQAHGITRQRAKE